MSSVTTVRFGRTWSALSERALNVQRDRPIQFDDRERAACF
jgi:hypothetical protein